MTDALVSPQHQPITNDQPALWSLVIADMQARDDFGRAKYGTPLQAFNGRDALVDAYQEALDKVVYLRQAIIEREWMVREIATLRAENEDLRRRLDAPREPSTVEAPPKVQRIIDDLEREGMDRSADEVRDVVGQLLAENERFRRQLAAVPTSVEVAAEPGSPAKDWSLIDIVRHLVAAHDHLYDEHQCDTHGWELWRGAKFAGRAWLARLEVAPPSAPEPLCAIAPACDHGISGGCALRCACGHTCRWHNHRDGCTDDVAVEDSRTLTKCECNGFTSQSGEG